MLRDSINILLAKDSEVVVRKALAENPEISEDVQRILAADVSDVVVTALSFNPNLCKAVKDMKRVSKLKLEGKNYSVRRKPLPEVHLTDSQKSELLEHKTKDALILLALDNGSTKRDHEELLKLLNHTEVYEGKKVELFSWPKIALLLNQNVDPEILANFEKSSDEGVQTALASNLNCPMSSLIKLLKKKKTIRCYLANPNWYEVPPFFDDIWRLYSRSGLAAIKAEEQKSKNFYEGQLKAAYKTNSIINYKILIRELSGN